MKIQQFQGGQSSRVRPQFVGQNEAVVYENIDNSAGTLTPVKTKLATAISVLQYNTYYEAEAQWVSSATERDYVEFQDTLYWTERAGGAPQKFDGTNTWNLGIEAPTGNGTPTVTTYPDVVDTVNITPNTAGVGLPVEDMYYAIINADGGTKYSDALVMKVGDDERLSTVQEATSAPLTPLVAVKDTGATRDIEIKNPTGITIGSNGVLVFRLYEGTYYQVGSLATSSSTLTDSTHDISGNAVLDETKFGVMRGVYQYAMTYYNSVDGAESGPSTPSAEIDISNGGTISLASIPVSSDPQVDEKRLYRVGGNLTSFTLVTTLANATTTYNDVLADTAIDGRLLEASTYSQAESDFKFLTEAYAMLFAAQGNRLRFTPIGVPDAWPELNFIDYEADITGIAPVANGILIFTKFKTHIVTGTGPTSLTTQLLRGDQGCLTHSSVQPLEGAALWVSTDGICTSSGGNVALISKDKLGKLSLSPVDSAIYDEAYYILDADGSILVFDYGYGKIFKSLQLGVSALTVANDILYGWSNAVQYELFNGSTFETFRYLSPRFIEGASTEHKTYKRVNIYSKGDIIIKTLINDVEVTSNTLTGEDSFDIQVPSHLQRGFFIQFDISGTGEVYEIEWIVGRQKGGK